MNLIRRSKKHFQKKNVEDVENTEIVIESVESDTESYTKCQECGKEYTYDEFYCKPCNSAHFRDNFAHWTSGDSNIDELIQNSQLNAEDLQELIEWIEYTNFENIEFVAHGGFGSVYKAIWKDGPIKYEPWNIRKFKWNRISNKKVAVKKFRNVNSVSLEFLNEVKSNLKLNSNYGCNEIYGVTRDPQSGEYAIVIEFQDGGNIRALIKKNHSNLKWGLLINALRDISNGLGAIHVENYHHKDFHSGNILNKIDSDSIYSVISDFGLSCPADQSSADKMLYGVLPFVAPEVLRGGEFTKAADIYGFGMLMSEIISGEAPFIDRDYDLHLALDICKGERPQIPEYTPEPYAALMKRCWDPIPTNRPTAGDLNREIIVWRDIINIDRQLAFSQEREDMWKAQLAELAKNPHPLKKSQNLLTSKQLDYSKHLSKLLETNDFVSETNDEEYHTRQFDMSL